MRWTEVGSQECSVARALSVVGDRWTMLIVREAFLRTRKFDDFLHRVGASRNIVSDRLHKLVEEGVLERRRYEDKPPRYEYRLTAKGRDLYPVLVSLLAWGDRWMVDENGPPLRLVHTDCGCPMSPKLVCESCDQPVDAKRVAVLAGDRAAPFRSD